MALRYADAYSHFSSSAASGNITVGIKKVAERVFFSAYANEKLKVGDSFRSKWNPKGVLIFFEPSKSSRNVAAFARWEWYPLIMSIAETVLEVIKQYFV